jgi:tetratricopeptide (TPR) repeat protein
MHGQVARFSLTLTLVMSKIRYARSHQIFLLGNSQRSIFPLQTTMARRPRLASVAVTALLILCLALAAVRGEQTKMPSTTVESAVQTVASLSSEKRIQGKEYHDEGDFELAARHFGEAANLLNGNTSNEADIQECATCRLHEALCLLKCKDYPGAIEACSLVVDSEGVIEPALRARALHRRAKAYLELEGEEERALQDARSAAFLGDRKAVALYGKLMRTEQSEIQYPFLPTAATSSPMPSNGNIQSMVTTLVKKLEDEQTLNTICSFLNSASGPQLASLANMAGVPLPSARADKLAQFANSVTPKTIQKVVRISKRGIYVFQLFRKTVQVIQKYRNVLILLLLLAWIKSAVLRPIPIRLKR